MRGYFLFFIYFIFKIGVRGNLFLFYFSDHKRGAGAILFILQKEGCGSYFIAILSCFSPIFRCFIHLLATGKECFCLFILFSPISKGCGDNLFYFPNSNRVRGQFIVKNCPKIRGAGVQGGCGRCLRNVILILYDLTVFLII